MHIFQELVNTLKRFGLEGIQKYYSLYEGKVLDNDDPNKQGRVKVECSKIGAGQSIGWAYPISRNNFVSIPKVGDSVWLFFSTGNARFPRYIHSWWGEDDMPEKALDDYPNVHLWETSTGNILLMNDVTGKVYIENNKGAFD